MAVELIAVRCRNSAEPPCSVFIYFGQFFLVVVSVRKMTVIQCSYSIFPVYKTSISALRLAGKDCSCHEKGYKEKQKSVHGNVIG